MLSEVIFTNKKNSKFNLHILAVRLIPPTSQRIAHTRTTLGDISTRRIENQNSRKLSAARARVIITRIETTQTRGRKRQKLLWLRCSRKVRSLVVSPLLYCKIHFLCESRTEAKNLEHRHRLKEMLCVLLPLCIRLWTPKT